MIVESPSIEFIVEPLLIEVSVFKVVQIFVVSHISNTKGSQTDRKGLGYFSRTLENVSPCHPLEIFRRQVSWLFVHSFLDIGYLQRPREWGGHSDPSVFVEEGVIRSDINKVLSALIGLVPGPDQGVQEEPNLYLGEFGLLAPAIIDLFGQQVGVVVIVDLDRVRCTRALPVCPHMAVLLKLLLAGSNKLSGRAKILLQANFHLSYSFSSMAMEVCKYFASPLVTIFDFWNLGWLILMSNYFFWLVLVFPIQCFWKNYYLNQSYIFWISINLNKLFKSAE